MSPWILASPASRGLGFALAKRVLNTTTLPVVSTARKEPERVRDALLEATDPANEKRLHVLTLDVTDEDSIAAAADQCRSKFASSHLHLALTLPGILNAEKSPRQLKADTLRETFAVNTLGPMLMMKHFAPFLPSKKTETPLLNGEETQGLPSPATWLAMSARVGSISDNRLGGWYGYRASKAALNSAIRSFDLHLRNVAGVGDRAVAVGMHPGTVKTDLSKDFWGGVPAEKLFEPDYAAERILDVVSKFGGEEYSADRVRGRCWDWKGEEIPP